MMFRNDRPRLLLFQMVRIFFPVVVFRGGILFFFFRICFVNCQSELLVVLNDFIILL